jgi:hypothetical protein
MVINYNRIDHPRVQSLALEKIGRHQKSLAGQWLLLFNNRRREEERVL